MSKRALVVGCNYPNTDNKLEGCVNDALRMKEMLLKYYGFHEKDIVLMIDTDKNYPQPTGANIRKALSKIVANTEAGDVLVMHFSGHGTQIPPESGIPDDTGMDECIVPTDMNLLTDDDFREIVNTLPAGVILTFICDCCHSGGLIDHEKEQIGNSTTGSRGAAPGISSREFHLSGYAAQNRARGNTSREYHPPTEYGRGYGSRNEDDRREDPRSGERFERNRRDDDDHRPRHESHEAYGRRQDYDGREDDERGQYRGRSDQPFQGGRDSYEREEPERFKRGGYGKDEEDFEDRNRRRYGEEETYERHDERNRHRFGEDENYQRREEGNRRRYEDGNEYGRDGGRHGPPAGGFGGGFSEEGNRRSHESEYEEKHESIYSGGYASGHVSGGGSRAPSIKNRGLSITSFMSMLGQKAGTKVAEGAIRTTLYSAFGKDASPMVQMFVGVLIKHGPAIMSQLSGNGNGDLVGMLSTIALDFVQSQMGGRPGGPNITDALAHMTPLAQQAAQADDDAPVLAGWKPPPGSRVSEKMGILVSGCQAKETSADVKDNTKAFGALSNAIQMTVAAKGGKLTYHELVMDVRALLKKQGFEQNPGLYCSDENVNAPFICD